MVYFAIVHRTQSGIEKLLSTTRIGFEPNDQLVKSCKNQMTQIQHSCNCESMLVSNQISCKS